MAYREAKTDKEKKRGKSTDELSLKEATAFFKKRGKEKGATKFRWRGDVYNLSGEKIGGEKTSTKTESSAPKSTSKRPQARRTDTKALSNPPTIEERKLSNTRGGRGNGVAEMARRALDRPNSGTKAKQAKTKLLRSAGINYDTWEKMTRPERREAGLPETTVGWQNQSLINDPIGWMKKQLGLTAKVPSTDSSERKGMSKGGMVKSGNKDYKKSGMFYKSGSPRGYK